MSRCSRTARPCEADILGHDVTYKLGAPGRHLVHNSLAVLAAAALVGADLALAALALAEFQPPTGRGERIALDLPGGDGAAHRRELQRQSRLDARRAGAARPGAARPARPAHRRAGRHAGTRPARAAALHRGLAESDRLANAIDLVFCCGPLMRSLWQALPAEPPRRLCRDLGGARAAAVAALRAGDAVMVKGSLGSRMGPIVKALKRLFARAAALARPRPRKVDAMLYWLIDLSDTALRLQRLSLHHLPHRRRGDHRAAVRVPVRPAIIDRLRVRQGKGQPIRTDGPKSHILTKAGTPTMGGLMILSGIIVSTLLWANLRNPYVWVVLLA